MDLSPTIFILYQLIKCAVYPLSWFVAILVALVILLFLPLSPSRLRLLRGLAVLALCLLFSLGNAYVANSLVGLIESQYPPYDPVSGKAFDAIVVLGGGVAGKGTLRPTDELSGSSQRRTICGVELFAKSLAPRILFSGRGWAFSGDEPSEGDVMKAFAVRFGVPADAILVETQSRNTYENAVESKRMLGGGSILLVTSAVHIPRAMGLFRKQGFEATPFPCGYLVANQPGEAWNGDIFDLIPDIGALSRSTAAITEFVGLLVYRLRRLI
ncbi:MAG: YdcF family protein [Nitrospiraceae bacterium]